MTTENELAQAIRRAILKSSGKDTLEIPEDERDNEKATTITTKRLPTTLTTKERKAQEYIEETKKYFKK